MAGPTERLLRLLSTLQAGGSWSGPELARQLGVTARTVRRDVERLRDLGYAVDADPGRVGGYRLGRGGRHVPPLILDDEEAVILAACLRAAGGTAPVGSVATTERLLLRLQQLLPARAGDEVATLSAATTRLTRPGEEAEVVAPAVLGTVSRASRECLLLHVRYRDARGHETERRLEPLGIVSAGRRWYLVARDERRRDWRTFRLDRVVEARATGHGFVRVDPPDPVRVVQRAITTAPYVHQADIELDAPLAEVGPRIPPTAGVVEALDDGRTLLTAGADDLDLIAFHVLRLGVPFRIRRPEALRQRCAELGARLLDAAAGAGGSGPPTA
jgi:predicted DNA-binding transcriptional regulator YafY